ncbi:MAG: hypothetical protein U0524_00145 [Candidatus Saccharimonadales bacterium]
MSVAAAETHRSWEDTAEHGSGLLGGVVLGTYALAETASLITGAAAGLAGFIVCKNLVKQLFHKEQ